MTVGLSVPIRGTNFPSWLGKIVSAKIQQDTVYWDPSLSVSSCLYMYSLSNGDIDDGVANIHAVMIAGMPITLI